MANRYALQVNPSNLYIIDTEDARILAQTTREDAAVQIVRALNEQEERLKENSQR